MSNDPVLVIPLVATAAVTATLGIYAWRRSTAPFRRSVALILVSFSLFAIAYSLELLSESLPEKMFWNDLEYIFIAAICPAYVFFLSEYLGRDRWRSAKVLSLLAVIPTACLLLLWTNDHHHLFYTSTSISQVGPFTTFTPHHGPAFLLLSAQNYIVLIVCVTVLVSFYLDAPRAHRRPISLIIAATVAPWTANVIYFAGLSPLPGNYNIVIAFNITAALLFWGAVRHDLFDLLPLALGDHMENTQDGVVVLDRNARIVHVNPAAGRVLREKGEVVGQDCARVLPALASHLPLVEDQDLVVHMGEGDRKRSFQAQFSTLRTRSGAPAGTVVMLRERTKELATEEALRVAHARLSLLTSITRHDTLNLLVAAKGYTELLRLKAPGPEVNKYTERILSSLSSIEREMTFTRDYQNLGVSAPQWLSLSDLVAQARSASLVGSFEVTVEVMNTEILADPMVVKVFTNLFDNSVRHAQGLGHISIYSCRRGAGLLITYNDDGIGIPTAEKERIFELGYGRNTGLGLYFARQVLGCSDMTVQETGEEGKGARFEIFVPWERWRPHPHEGPSRPSFPTCSECG